MGKRSQARTQWLTMSQRESRGKAQSGARLWFLDPKKPKPHKPAPIPQRERPDALRGVTVQPEPQGTSDAEAVQSEAPVVPPVQTAQDGSRQSVDAQGAGSVEGVPA